MIARVTHAEKRAGAARWGATAIFVRDLRPAKLELYPAAYAGDGAELTGLQVLDEFETISGPVILAPLTEAGLVYDVALTHAFERDAELTLGSGWPPVVVGFDARVAHDPRELEIEAADVEPLFRDPAGPDVGVRGAGLVATGFGAAQGALGGGWLDAFALVAGGTERPFGANVVVLVTDAEIGPRALRRLAEAALDGLASVGWFERTLAVAVSSATGSVPRRGSVLPRGAEVAAIAATAHAAERALAR